MKFGVREICEVVLKAKAAQKVGNKIFYKGEPVIYFDTLKTSSMEGAATTVYAQGGRGNSRLVAWEGERTVTFTMEDALISPEGFMILSGAGLIEASAGRSVKQHITEKIDKNATLEVKAADGSISVVDRVSVNGDEATIYVAQLPYFGDFKTSADGEATFHASKDDMAYVMFVNEGDIVSEPYIPEHVEPTLIPVVFDEITRKEYYQIQVKTVSATADRRAYSVDNETGADSEDNIFAFTDAFDSLVIDYYTEKKSHAMQIEITPDKFGGNYYLEASTLFRTTDGVDMPAEFIIPNCKIQSNFTFTMASSGDPSTFTFTMDAFPDYTRFDHSKKVLAAIQIIEDAASMDLVRSQTYHDKEDDKFF